MPQGIKKYELHDINKITDLKWGHALKWNHFSWNQFQAPQNESLSVSCFKTTWVLYKFLHVLTELNVPKFTKVSTGTKWL